MGNEGSKLKGLVVEKNAVEANDFFSLHDGDTTLSSTAKTTTTTNEEGRLGRLSVFRGERNVGHHLWGIQGALKHATKNLMIYRHPYIIKYIATWEKSGETCLATERVRPLSSVLSTLSDIQICLGLRNILCGLIFLTDKAMARHLNICITSIYITEKGSWRLAGFEFVWKSSDVKKSLLEVLHSYRYQPAIDPEELKSNENMNTIEQYSFATLCMEILSRNDRKNSLHSERSDCETPHAAEFREYCMTILRTKKPEMRPKLAAVLLHPYFNHEFVLIHSFLFELPLKSVSEKQTFFTSLIDRLRYFNEKVVAAQLTGDLLSRMVLLDPTAQLCVTPYILKTKSIENSAALFSRETYSEILMPKIFQMFRLRDAQIRLILLEYFMEYVRLLSEKELKEFILPHLLDGMNDTNDVLVAKTLRCLADLIPILGATEVLGERMRLFADGRPQAATTAENTKHWVEPRSITPVLTSGNCGRLNSDDDDDDVGFVVSGSPLPNANHISGSLNSLEQSELNDISNGDQQLLTEMPPRLSPDGGEDEKSIALADGIVGSTDEISLLPYISNGESTDYDNTQKDTTPKEIPTEIMKNTTNNIQSDAEDPWSDWEAEDEVQSIKVENNISIPNSETEIIPKLESPTIKNTDSKADPSTKRTLSKQINDDLNTFDIQVQKSMAPSNEKSDEFDFFKDMEPVIKPTSHVNSLTSKSSSRVQSLTMLNTIERTNEDEEVLIDTSRFAAVTQYNDSNNDIEISLQDGTFGDGNGWDVEDDDDNTACLKNTQ